MPTFVEREILITYGGYEIGGDADSVLTGFYQSMTGHLTSSVEFTFIVAEETAEDFALACYLAEEAFRKPYQSLAITIDGSNLLARSQSANSGLDARPEIVKAEDEVDSGRSRKYTIRVEFDMPADTGSLAGRRESTIDVAYSSSRRRTVTFAGEWTAVDSNDARDQFDAQVSSWTTAALSAFGGTYEIVDESVEESTNDKSVRFRQVYKEILRDQSGSGTDDAGIVDPVLTIQRTRVNRGHYPDPKATPLVRLEGTFDAGIDAEVTTDLDAKWNSIKAWIIDEITAFVTGGQVAVVRIEPEFDEHENRLRATIECLATDGEGSSIIESSIDVTDSMKIGREFVPAWTGAAFSAYMHEAPAELIRTVVWAFRIVGHVSPESAAAQGDSKANGMLSKPYTRPHGSGGQWEEVDRNVRSSQSDIGIPPDTIGVTDITATVAFRYYVPAESSGGGATHTPTGGQYGPRPVGTSRTENDKGPAGR